MAVNTERIERVPVKVIGVDYWEGSDDSVVRAVISNWNSGLEFGFPITRLTDRRMRESVGPGDILLVEVNLAAQTPDELAMRHFEKAPSLPISENGLNPQ